MTIPSQLTQSSTSNWMFPLKVVLISSGVLSMAVMLNLFVPVITQFAISEFPSIWSFLVSWFSPPYHYLLINCIILTIVASSKFRQKVDESPPEAVVPIKISGDVREDFSVAALVEVQPEFGYGYDANVVIKASDSRVLETKTTNASEEMSGGDEPALSNSSWSTPQRNSTEYSISTEKPLVSLRFGHRKDVKASPEGGKTLGVSKPKRQDTLESTWKTITEGRSMPLTRHLRKSETTQGRHTNVGHHQAQAQTTQRVTKSETFNDRSPSPGSGKLRREPSLGQDELNRRVEAFIKKFNEEMRLQRQESLNQYMEMINRGAH
uniref:DUF4408 domain-containing protein n=1 Tax=Davidia involucrata TaxID=16924 RepID=A0A5B7BJI1_DAVIN